MDKTSGIQSMALYSCTFVAGEISPAFLGQKAG
jgi:hypothetical protein